MWVLLFFGHPYFGEMTAILQRKEKSRSAWLATNRWEYCETSPISSEEVMLKAVKIGMCAPSTTRLYGTSKLTRHSVKTSFHMKCASTALIQMSNGVLRRNLSLEEEGYQRKSCYVHLAISLKYSLVSSAFLSQNHWLPFSVQQDIHDGLFFVRLSQ